MYCKDCKHRDNRGHCRSDKLDEDYWYDDEYKKDMLIYSYTEGGRFWVGEYFGCVHFSEKPVAEVGGG